MIRIGITGSIASGKTTASKIISKKKGPLFSADKVVKKLYLKKNFVNLIKKRFKILPELSVKQGIKDKILSNKTNLKKLEKILHPLVRKEMRFFLKKNKNKKLLFLEIPLLVESKLTKYFDLIIFIKSKLQIRKKRYILKKGDPLMFDFLNNHQFKDSKKIRHCDHIVVNNRSLSILKKNLLNIMKKL